MRQWLICSYLYWPEEGLGRPTNGSSNLILIYIAQGKRKKKRSCSRSEFLHIHSVIINLESSRTVDKISRPLGPWRALEEEIWSEGSPLGIGGLRTSLQEFCTSSTGIWTSLGRLSLSSSRTCGKYSETGGDFDVWTHLCCGLSEEYFQMCSAKKTFYIFNVCQLSNFLHLFKHWQIWSAGQRVETNVHKFFMK